MAKQVNPALAALPQDKKDKLKELTRLFDLDWSAAEIKVGVDATLCIAQMDKQAERSKRLSDRIEMDRLVFSPKVDQKISPQSTSAGPAPALPIKAKARFAVDDWVYLIRDAEQARQQVSDVLNLSFGRTGFWYVLRGIKKPVEQSNLEFCAELVERF